MATDMKPTGPSPSISGGKLRLSMGITYDLNGEDIEEMKARLHRMVEHAIGDGMLTGETSAEVDEYWMDVHVVPEPMGEEQLADYFLQRIESGNMRLEDIPTMLARYGLLEPPAFIAEMMERMQLDEKGG